MSVVIEVFPAQVVKKKTRDAAIDFPPCLRLRGKIPCCFFHVFFFWLLTLRQASRPSQKSSRNRLLHPLVEQTATDLLKKSYDNFKEPSSLFQKQQKVNMGLGVRLRWNLAVVSEKSSQILEDVLGWTKESSYRTSSETRFEFSEIFSKSLTEDVL